MSSCVCVFFLQLDGHYLGCGVRFLGVDADMDRGLFVPAERRFRRRGRHSVWQHYLLVDRLLLCSRCAWYALSH